MNISLEQLRELVLRVQKELEAEKERAGKDQAGKDQAGNQGKRRKLYMLCRSCWDERYGQLLTQMDVTGFYDVYPVIPSSWKKQGYEAALMEHSSCRQIVYRSCTIPEDLEEAATVFPVVERDVIVKTALCISDTFETAWIAGCIESGGRIVLLRSGLKKFSGREQPAYRNRIMSYYRQVLEYGIEICDIGELSGRGGSPQLPEPVQENKRVIASSNIEQFASDGVIYLRRGDIVTDLAKDRAKFLKIVFR